MTNSFVSPYADDTAFAKRARRPVLARTAAAQVVAFAGPAWISGVNRTKPIKQGRTFRFVAETPRFCVR